MQRLVFYAKTQGFRTVEPFWGGVPGAGPGYPGTGPPVPGSPGPVPGSPGPVPGSPGPSLGSPRELLTTAERLSPYVDRRYVGTGVSGPGVWCKSSIGFGELASPCAAQFKFAFGSPR
jgi:hypothetical protein